jgi:hypothetical protein
MVGERGGRKMKRREEAEGLFKAKPDEWGGRCVCVCWVVISRAFFFFRWSNHITNIKKFFFRRSQRQRNFSLFYFASQES